MKKTFLTLALAIFVMAGFSNNIKPLKPSIKEVKIEKKLDQKQQTENKSDEDLTNKKSFVEAPCLIVELSCGPVGYVCGNNWDEILDNYYRAELIHCYDYN